MRDAGIGRAWCPSGARSSRAADDGNEPMAETGQGRLAGVFDEATLKRLASTVKARARGSRS